MQVHYSMESLPVIPSPVVTVGSFDGVHVGHRVIIKRLNDLAAEYKGSSVLISFHPHPRLVLYPETSGKDLKLINSQKEKISLLEATGLDHLIILVFTRDFAHTSSDDFVEHYLVGKLHAHTIVVGFNHYFGYKREGNYASLYQARDRFSFRVEEIPEQEIQHETVSSTRIRKALKEGNIQRANAYLEHYYMIRAKIFNEAGQSRRQGNPLMKIRVEDPLKLIPPKGSYAATFVYGDRNEKAFVHLGEKDIFLYPLNAEAVPGSGEVIIHFHLRLSESAYPDPSRLLDKVRELIY